MTSRSSPWPTVAGGQATGGRDSDTPSNFRMQRSALRAAADPERSPHKRYQPGDAGSGRRHQTDLKESEWVLE
jgi:hypothetical protein